MRKPATKPDADPDTIPRLPGWITSDRVETPEDVAFLSGAALACLHLVAMDEKVPHDLWRARLALGAAEACAAFAGRREGSAQLRDAVHLLRPGDHPGPAGEIFRQWCLAVGRRISVANLGKALPGLTAEQIAARLDPAGGTPVVRAAAVLEAVLAAAPRTEAAALILADAALAKALGWDHVLPLLANGLKARDLRRQGDDLRWACHRAVGTAAGLAVPMAADLARRAARLRGVVPRLRAKGATKAVEMLLSRDALAPAALDFMSDRAARRLCDRLVDLGAVRELTGRDTFRLYGV
jgi:Protein of unknown function (DUF1403)